MGQKELDFTRNSKSTAKTTKMTKTRVVVAVAKL